MVLLCYYNSRFGRAVVISMLIVFDDSSKILGLVSGLMVLKSVKNAFATKLQTYRLY